MKQNEKGFTLSELIIVIAIISILAIGSLMVLTKWIGKTKVARVASDMNTIEKVMEMYKVENSSSYPDPDNSVIVALTWEDGVHLWKQWVLWKDWVNKISELTNIPIDPWTDEPYVYSVSNDWTKYQISSVWLNGQAYFKSQNYVYANDYKALVKWNYNNKVLLVKGDKTYLVPIPSLIIDDLAYVEEWSLKIHYITWEVNFVIDWQKNYPSNHKTKIGWSSGPKLKMDVFSKNWDIDVYEDITKINNVLSWAYEEYANVNDEFNSLAMGSLEPESLESMLEWGSTSSEIGDCVIWDSLVWYCKLK